MKSFTGPLKLCEGVPYLNLPSVRDGQVNLWDLRQRRNLVLVFFHGTYCFHCIAKLKEIAEAYEKFDDLEAEILAISSDNLEKLRRIEKRIGIPFHLLSDKTGKTIERFTYIDPAGNIPFPSVLITDRFGVLRYQEIVSEAHELVDVKEMLSWLLLLQTECPECSHL